jgi:hypothetical protein
VFTRSKEKRWFDELFLRRACERISVEIEWDSIDSGRLHWTTVACTSESGQRVIVGVFSEHGRLSDVLQDADRERKEEGLPEVTPLWLYFPKDMDISEDVPDYVVLKSVD